MKMSGTAADYMAETLARAGVKRFVMVSYFGAGPGHGVPQGDPFFPYAQAKAAADAHLRASDLNWTVLGPGRLTLEPATGRIVIGAGSEVSRADVALVVAAVLAIDSTIGRTLKKTVSNRTAASAGSFRQRPTAPS